MLKYIIPYRFLALFIEDFMTHSSIDGRGDVGISHIRKELGGGMEGGLVPHARVVGPGNEIDRKLRVCHLPPVVGVGLTHHGHERIHTVRSELEGPCGIAGVRIAYVGIRTGPGVSSFGRETPVELDSDSVEILEV